MRVVARPNASIAKRAARSRRFLAPSVFTTAVLAGGVAACGVTLPTPPPTTTDAERLCVLECQSQHSACVNGGGSPYVQALEPPIMQAWSVDSRKRSCADALGTCYASRCQKPAGSP
jgi:hypothetical protein